MIERGQRIMILDTEVAVMTKIYALVWLLVIGAAGVFYFTGNFSDITATVFGFIVSTLVFAGLVAVLPWWVDKQYSWEY